MKLNTENDLMWNNTLVQKGDIYGDYMDKPTVIHISCINELQVSVLLEDKWNTLDVSKTYTWSDTENKKIPGGNQIALYDKLCTEVILPIILDNTTLDNSYIESDDYQNANDQNEDTLNNYLSHISFKTTGNPIEEPWESLIRFFMTTKLDDVIEYDTISLTLEYLKQETNNLKKGDFHD